MTQNKYAASLLLALFLINSPLTKRREVDGSVLTFHFQDPSPSLLKTLQTTKNTSLLLNTNYVNSPGEMSLKCK